MFCMCHSTSGTGTVNMNSIMYVYKSNLCHKGWSYTNKENDREWTALLVEIVMLLNHTPSERKCQCPENNQMNF